MEKMDEDEEDEEDEVKEDTYRYLRKGRRIAQEAYVQERGEGRYKKRKYSDKNRME